MATYKTDRDRKYGFVGKFKFSYTVTLISDARGATFGVRFNNAQINSGALISFKDDVEFAADITIGRRFPSEDPNGLPGNFSNWFDPQLTSPNYDLINYGPKIPLKFKIKNTGLDLRGEFILDIQPDLDVNKDSFFTKGQGGQGVDFYFRYVSGTVEGYVFDGRPLTELVEISEHYPLKELRVPNTCNTTNQVWVQEELTEKTVRQWPKYTTINWFETINSNLRSRAGIYVIHTKSNGQTSTHSRFLDYSNNSFSTISYGFTKTAAAWQTRQYGSGPSIPSSGYIRIGGNVDFGEYKIEPLIVPNGIVTEDTWDLRSDTNWSAKALITIYQEPTRKVTFDSQIYHWNKPYNDYLKGLIMLMDDSINFFINHVLSTRDTMCDVSSTHGALRNY